MSIERTVAIDKDKAFLTFDVFMSNREMGFGIVGKPSPIQRSRTH
jgi:hypothetical protein